MCIKTESLSLYMIHLIYKEASNSMTAGISGIYRAQQRSSLQISSFSSKTLKLARANHEAKLANIQWMWKAPGIYLTRKMNNLKYLYL